jgi:phage terminase large subunit-like protein
MSKKKTPEELRLSGAKRAKKAARQAEMAAPDVLGEPLRPQGEDRNFRRIWNQLAKELLEAKKLSKADGSLLERLVRARRGSFDGDDSERTASRLEYDALRQEFDSRAPFIESKPAPKVERPVGVPSLPDFIASVKRERDTFFERMGPDQVITMDEGGKPYEFPEGDALTVAKKYAESVVSGEQVAGKLTICACKRFLENLTEGGRQRGFWMDPWACRSIVDFFKHYYQHPLLPWMTLVVCDSFGWKRATGYRLRSRCWVEVAKKNAKSYLLSGICLFTLVADQEERAEVYSFGTKVSQAKIVWGDSYFNCKRNPELAEHVITQKTSLSIEETGSSFTAIASDQNTCDGLRVHAFSADECHEYRNDLLVRKMLHGQLSRRQPMALFATTAGPARDENFCWTQHEIFCRLLEKVTVDDPYFDDWTVYIYSLDEDEECKDDILDESKWIKANPSLGEALPLDNLRRDARALKTDLNAIRDFRRYDMNLWNTIDTSTGSLPSDIVAYGLGIPNMPSGSLMQLRETFLKDCETFRANPAYRMWAGYDHGASDDFASFSLYLPAYRFMDADGKLTEEKMVCCNFYWICKEKIVEREGTLRVPLNRWCNEGWIRTTGKKYVDREQVYSDILAICQRFNVTQIGFDGWAMQDFVQSLNKERKGLAVIVKQKGETLNIPSETFLRAMLDKKLVYLDPVFRWMAANCDFTADGNGAKKPHKPKCNEGDTDDKKSKIDGVASLVNAIHRHLNPDQAQGINNWTNRFYSREADLHAAGQPTLSDAVSKMMGRTF